MGPTIHDVARLANTSKSTVSRYLNGWQVKRPTEEAIKKAIEELNYHRNANARRLVLNRTNLIAVVVNDISNIFYSGIIRGIEEVANRKGYSCLFFSWASNGDEEVSFLKLLYEGQVDGVIMVSFWSREQEDLIRIRETPYPVVLVGDSGEVEDLLAVEVDNVAGAADIVHYLHGLGHRDIAYIAGPANLAANRDRIKGYRQAMNQLNVEMNPDWFVTSDWSNQGGFEAMNKLLKAGGFTAVIASNDETAIGALRAVQEHGLSVPKHMSIVGYDDITISKWVYPSLTTVHQPFYDVGIRAGEGLFHKIEGAEDRIASGTILLKPNLIIRDSCAQRSLKR